jgi:glucose-1-phosphate thymidylyltransferase
LAGKGTRLRPHTFSKPKPLVHVAGKPVLGHLIDQYKDLNPEEIIFVTGDMEEQIKDYVSKNYRHKVKYIRQEQLLGDGHAIMHAKDYVLGEVIINFNDTLFKTDLSLIKKTNADGIIWVKETSDPRRFGIVSEHNGIITNIEEKPEHPKSNLAIIGLYYFKDAKLMFDYLQKAVDKKISSKGELRLADALGLMLKDKINLAVLKVDTWLDTGKPETLLKTNEFLLKNGCAQINGYEKNNTIIPPVYLEEGSKIEYSVIGPNVSIAKGAVIHRSSIENSIVGQGAHLSYKQLSSSLIGDNTTLTEKPKKLNIGDNSEVIED